MCGLKLVCGPPVGVPVDSWDPWGGRCWSFKVLARISRHANTPGWDALAHFHRERNYGVWGCVEGAKGPAKLSWPP